MGDVVTFPLVPKRTQENPFTKGARGRKQLPLHAIHETKKRVVALLNEANLGARDLDAFSKRHADVLLRVLAIKKHAKQGDEQAIVFINKSLPRILDSYSLDKLINS